MQRDPLGTAVGPSLFSYSEERPVTQRDPLGLWSAAELMAMNQVLPGPPGVGLGLLMGLSVRAWMAPHDLEGSGYEPNARDGPGDAYKHCVWQCLIAQTFGESTAVKIGNIHENFGSAEAEAKAREAEASGNQGAADRIRADAEASRRMDLWNNAQGQDCAERGQDCNECCLKKLNDGALLNAGGRAGQPTGQGTLLGPAIGPNPCGVTRKGLARRWWFPQGLTYPGLPW